MTNLFPNTQMLQRPGIIDLAWGHPSPTLLPLAELQRAAVSMVERHGAAALAYGAERGAGPLLTWLHERINRLEGRALTPEEITTTAGNSDALDQICALWTQPGDVVLVETPTYHLAVRIMRDHPLDLVPVPADAAGLRVDALADTIAQLRRAGRRPRLLYLVPTFNNPTGASLSAERRRALVELAAAEELLIVEDDVYRELSYDGAAPPSLWSLAESGVVARLGSFAKTLAPGLRVGWLTGGAALVRRLVDSGLRDSGGGVNHFAAMVAAEFNVEGRFEAHVASLRAAYRARRDALLAGLAASLPAGCVVRAPAGGYFTWVTLPEGLDAKALLPRAEANGVSYLPGTRFHLDGGGASALRLAFSYYSEAELAEAARRLGAVIGEALA
ncbi:MAG TPA: PLP-dependent aminotransferase family protein [Roseiflexaceae bacterium]|nr:PLP-dependent aminotransferase family protein [Roseiflexaceae bacterium]